LDALLASSGDRATAVILAAALVVSLVVLAWVCWFFWRHRHDD